MISLMHNLSYDSSKLKCDCNFLCAEQQTPTSHCQSQLPFNLDHNISTSAMASPAATDPNVQESIPTQVEEPETDYAGIQDAPQEESVIRTDYQNGVRLQQRTNVQTAVEKQINEMTMLRQQNESLVQLLQEQQKKIKALEEKVDKIIIEQKQHNENFENKISLLQQEVHRMKQKDQNKPLTNAPNQLQTQTAKDLKY